MKARLLVICVHFILPPSSFILALDPLRHQVAVVIHEAGLTVERLRAGVGALDFEVEGAYSLRAADALDELQSLAARAAPARFGPQVKRGEKGVAPAELQAVAEGEDDVADRRRARLDGPDAAQPLVKSGASAVGYI